MVLPQTGSLASGGTFAKEAQRFDITGNLADKAKKLGIPVLDHREGGA